MTLNVGALVQTAMAAVPSTLKAAVTFRRETPGTYTDATDTWSAPTVVTVTGTASQDEGDPDEYRALELIPAKARTLIFVPDTIGSLPLDGYTVVWGGVTYTVKSVAPIAPAGTGFAARIVVSV